MFTMKNKIILFSAIFISSLFGFNFLKAQTVTGQPHLQLSEGGQPWSFKFNDTDSDILFENLPVVDNQAMIDADEALVSSGVKSLRFGFDHYVSLKLTNSGAWTSLANGDKVWRLGLSSPGAISMNISFKSMNLPEGCRLFVYKDDKTEFHGAFTQTHVTADDGMLGTELLFGEKVIVELYVPQSELSTVSLEIWSFWCL
jgi:lysyl endopeptidase